MNIQQTSISILCFSIFLLFAANQNNEVKDSYTLEEALKEQLITVEFTNNAQGSHYTNPITVLIQNLKSKPFKLNINKGVLLNPNDPEYQTIIISNDMELPLAANQKKLKKNLSGFCTESHDAAPGASLMRYSIGKPCDEKMKKLIQFISENKLSNTYEGQNAVWTLANKSSLSNIVGYDTVSTKKLQKLLSDLTGKPMPKPPSAKDYKNNYYCVYEPKIEVKGNRTFQSSKPYKARVGMFDSSNVCVRELYVNNNCKPGVNKINYSFDASAFEGRYYYVKTIIDDKVIFNSEYDFKNITINEK